MCAVSAIGDYWQRSPNVQPYVSPAYKPEYATKVELAVLRQEVLQLRSLLLAAKRFDEATGQPHCETDDKVALIKRLAEMVGVDMGEVFK